MSKIKLNLQFYSNELEHLQEFVEENRFNPKLQSFIKGYNQAAKQYGEYLLSKKLK